MEVLGIIAEYNPFHKGHEYHLKKSMELSGADCSVAVMSGNFTQRGEAAVLDKWTRSRIAVEAGVDLVLELPFLFACNRAEIFAKGAVDILTAVKAGHIAFGSESGDLGQLESLACGMRERQEEIARARERSMKKGNSYAKGLQEAVERVLGKEKSALMLEPNNILALEYLKRILYHRERGQAPRPVAIKRCGSGYFDADEDSGFAGAGAIREMLREGKPAAERLKGWVPEVTVRQLACSIDIGAAEERAFQMIRGELISSSAEELARIYCVGEGIENKLKKEIIKASSLQQLIGDVVSRRYTEAAVRRILLYILMKVKAEKEDFPVYARVLAAGPKGRKLLRTLKNDDSVEIPILTNINGPDDAGDEISNMLRHDVVAADMYNALWGRDLYKFSDKVIKPFILE
ncbi:MAG: nucleotidyltransferase family protein [Bacillota bacterium]|nr:nucleotidyltransferase family protein [Bacillota bacterium]